MSQSFNEHFAATAVTESCAVCSQPRRDMHFFYEALGNKEAIIGFDASRVTDATSPVSGLYTTVHLAPQMFCSLECLRDYFLHRVDALKEQIKLLAAATPAER